MKIAIFAEDLPAGAGGGHTFIVEVIRALGRVPRGAHELVVYRTGRALDEVDLGALPVQLVGGGALGGTIERATQKISKGVRAVAELAGPALGKHAPHAWRKRLAEDDVKLVWSPGPTVPVLDVPFAVTVWDLQHRLQPWFPEVSHDGEWAYRERTTAETLRRAMRVVVGTQAGADEVQRFYGLTPDRLRVLPHPTPQFALAEAERARRERDAVAASDQAAIARLKVAEPFLLYPAQLWPHKNHATILAAVERMARAGRVVDVVFAGSDKGQGVALEAHARALGIGARVHLCGFVSQADLVSLYRRASVTVYSSMFGPENLPPLEAMALGCPVVASAVSGADEQLGDAALLFPATDAALLASQIERVLADAKLRDRLVERGRARAAQRTTDAFATRVVTMLDEMAAIRSTWA